MAVVSQSRVVQDSRIMMDSASGRGSILGEKRGGVAMADDTACNGNSRPRKHKNEGFGDFGNFLRYMAEKKRKLSLQFQAEASDGVRSMMEDAKFHLTSDGKPPSNMDVANAAVVHRDLTGLFDGISIFVDGFTIPSHQELRELMLKHGGRFENYFSCDVVTHIICSTLPDSKIRDHRSFSRGLPVVKPSWIVDSISCGRVLPVSSYVHERIARDHPNQSTLLRFLDSTKEDSNNCLLKKDVHMKNQSHNVHNPLASSHTSSSKKDIEHSPVSKKGLICDSKISSAHGSGLESPSEYARSHCTLGDANFVQNYFKNSRLHFIGTWRTRYQNRFGTGRENQDQQHDGYSTSDNMFRTIMHVDMDCFFVSVAVRNRPELVGKPLAVCHSDKTKGTAEISSSNYTARAFGVKSGMFIRDAKALCPDLEVVPYDFEGYEQVADEFYDILHKHCKRVQAVSCDEAYVDVTGVEDPDFLASQIRKEINDLTKCTASVGIAGNLLMARIATKKAKPDGQFRIHPNQVEDFLSHMSIEDLPGVGWSLQERLNRKGIYDCKQLQAIPKEILQGDFGVKTGDMLWCYARGIDNRQVQNYQERKSIGAEVNWGVRFNSPSDAHHFLTSLCEEVSGRLQEAFLIGRTLTLKIKKRKEGAREPEKFMGCGSCDNLSKSITLGCATNDAQVMLRVTKQIFASFHLDIHNIRGMGLQVTKLEQNVSSVYTQGQQHQKVLEACLQFSPKGNLGKKLLDDESVHRSNATALSEIQDRDNLLHINHQHAIPSDKKQKSFKEKKRVESFGKIRKGPFSGLKQPFMSKEKERQNVSSLPHYSELDQSVLQSLPPEIIAELDNAYSGAVIQNLTSFKTHVTGKRFEEQESFPSIPLQNILSNTCNEKEDHFGVQSNLIQSLDPKQSVGRTQTSSFRDGNGEPDLSSLSLSQVDIATLEELPYDVREDILRSLKTHKSNALELVTEVVENSNESDKQELLLSGGSSGLLHCHQEAQLVGLWDGDPPKWIELSKNLQGAGAAFLQHISKAFYAHEHPESLSCILRDAMHLREFLMPMHLDQAWEESMSFRCCLELFKQYLLSKISDDLEEVYIILHTVKRLATEAIFWKRIVQILVPFIQESVKDIYGGGFSVMTTGYDEI
ncbi:hypothetical protein KP509_1Z081200 [Ceratopteris richardii]|nr:hypothetical protein KP509_1Z081200 [Ceratopteris richardii]